ncbi:putative RNA recognition motif-containing protein [Neospora caninum Liverpool]|uniref:Peptidyl-prolyl cis-trans isomerase n=1 Tax=Neospora caninum (strain Liverpool) TaxID=572307 RepID=F0VLJ4_NEOCL|nr:putative RNA recognition motif-containing protein [Neospora caninum Liverpool]CBZ54122.1 putative RNA recognition motif-containing protein [Neospora caninum Liverpool]|eukprot:XP_003884153.1 putative RNA recognition motif-containing protein [Neospora caninum Liverpool]
MSVLLQTNVGEIVIDLFTDDAPFSSYNFLKLSKAKFFNNVAFHRVEKNFLAHAGAPVTADPRWNVAGLQLLGKAGEEDRHGCSVWGIQTLVESGEVSLRLPPAAQPAAPLKTERGESALAPSSSKVLQPASSLQLSSEVSVKAEPSAAPVSSFSSGDGRGSSPAESREDTNRPEVSTGRVAPKAPSLVGRTSFFSSVDFLSHSFPKFPDFALPSSSGASRRAPRAPPTARFCPDEGEGDSKIKTRKHDVCGVVGWVPTGGRGTEKDGDGNTSVFYITLRDKIPFLDERNLTIFGRVAEGVDILEKINLTFVDDDFVPLSPIRILHAFVLDDPFDDPAFLVDRSVASPLPLVEEVASDDEDLDEVLVIEKIEKKEAEARKVTLEILGDLPDADAKPPDNVLFVAKLNPVTQDEDLQTVFARFGDILACDIIRDWKTGRSLQYAFITFRESSACELAYFKMQNVLIDDRRIHVDFSQSVAKEWQKYKQFGNRQKSEDGEKKTSGFQPRSLQKPPNPLASSASISSRPVSSSSGAPDSARGFSDAAAPSSAAQRERGQRASGWDEADTGRGRERGKVFPASTPPASIFKKGECKVFMAHNLARLFPS